MASEPYVRHRVHVKVLQPRVYRFACECGVQIYLGPDSAIGENLENRHIREALGAFVPDPDSPRPVDWDHVATWFLLGWLLSN